MNSGMKNRLLPITTLVVVLILAGTLAQAQTSLKIILDTKKYLSPDPNCGLGADGLGGPSPATKVYAHLGCCASDEIFCLQQIKPFQSQVWEHVVGNWGDDDDIGIMTKDPTEDGVWTLEFIIEEYFSDPAKVNLDSSTLMPQGATPYTIGMVFRNEDGSLAGRDEGCKDIFLVKLQDPVPGVYNGFDSKPWVDSPVSFDVASGVEDQTIDVMNLRVFPNPSASNSQVRFYNRRHIEELTVRIYNTVGQEIRTLYQGEQSIGKVRLDWNGENNHGQAVPPGIYYLTVRSENHQHTQMIIRTQ